MLRLLLGALALSVSCGGSLAATCEDIAKLSLPNVTLAATAIKPPFELPNQIGPKIVIQTEFCRVEGASKPTSDSDIKFEVWLPISGWNGKYEGVGNGGLAGSLNYFDMAKALARGYATSSTDDGHQGANSDGRWALGHPEKIADFGWRAVHETALAAKAIVAAYYGDAPKHSYFMGCSDGGREGLMEAQRFPADYDGIVAGAPANDGSHVIVSLAWNARATTAPGAYFPANKLPAIQSAALNACRVTDGIVAAPLSCRPDPEKLLCHGAEDDQCLTRPQIEALRKIYGGAKEAGGKQLTQGYMPGSEADHSGFGGWTGWIVGQAPGKTQGAALATSVLANFVYDDPDWTLDRFDPARDLANLRKKFAPVVDAVSPDVGAFRARGGKIILYHGWADEAIQPQGTIAYYDALRTAVRGSKGATDFVRLFMAPGMQHCTGGPGPNTIGGSFSPNPADIDADHDVTTSLARWVEEGRAPDRIIATKFIDNNPGKGVAMTRPLDRYPLVAQFTGNGDRASADNYACRP